MSTTPDKLPRFADILASDKSARMSRRRSALVTQDGNTIVKGESYRIAGDPIALDERPAPSLDGITFDGAAPSDHK